MPTERKGARDAAREAAEAALWAPSVHNTQPWAFGLSGPRITLRADADRRLGVADPEGREMLISCGAALLTLRVAALALGYEPEVRVLPDPDRPNLVADVTLGGRAEANEDARRLYGAVRERRTHRGPFRAAGTGRGLPPALKTEAEREGARLIQAVEAHTAAALGALTQAAAHVQRLNAAYVAEEARWAPPPGSARPEGVHEEAYPEKPPQEGFAPREFARGRGWGMPAPAEHEPETGLVVLVTTPGDTPLDRVRAGQALQRVLLRAHAEDGLAAAFHTQPLEVPELREFIRTRFCNGQYPQALLRLGAPAGPEPASVRRPADAVIHQEP
ncbi:Acg family FMN-binding oxidoreductase [Actinomadura sp. 21ATH]|uniref:Acg family FMN-binding oxidoreductase n=1 Tax=Actinomadura sp. 21ATH TaxID=1735444 RepID=UPI0035BFAAC5